MDDISKMEEAVPIEKVALSFFTSIDVPAQMRMKIGNRVKMTPSTLCRHGTT
jgi:hypothetical protein